MTDDLAAIARRIVPLVDLTLLNDDDDEARVTALCNRVRSPLGAVAAVCVWPRFVSHAAHQVAGRAAIATVVNFPSGNDAPGEVIEDIVAAMHNGATEIDVVFPYTRFRAGQHEACEQILTAYRQVTTGRTLKVILETGLVSDPHYLRTMCEIAIRTGADFLKTSTGKTNVGATLAAAEVMLRTIIAAKRPVGLKISGGLRTTEQVAPYLALADRLMGLTWVSKATFRVGASSLIDDLLRQAGVIKAAPPAAAKSSY